MSASHLSKVESPASAFFVSQAIVTRVMAVHGSYDYDITGALEAGQYGIAFVAVRSALHAALFAYLARSGKVGTVPPDPREVGNHVFEVLAGDESERHVLDEAWALECLNPITADDVRACAERYRRFFSDVLRLDTSPSYGTLLTDSDYGRYLAFAEDLSNAFEHLGIRGINLPDARARAERRALVNRHLRGEQAPEAEPREGALPNSSAGGSLEQEPAPTSVQLRLTDEEAGTFARLVREQIVRLRAEISRIDGRDLRRDALRTQDVCERLLAKLQAPPA